MKNFMYATALAVGIFASVTTGTAGEWSLETAISNAQLVEENTFVDRDTSRDWDKHTIGVNGEIGYKLDSVNKFVVGYNTVTFEENKRPSENYSRTWVSIWPGIDIVRHPKMEELEASAFYLGLERTLAKTGIVEYYGTVEVGQSKLDDSAILIYQVGKIDAYKGGRRLYYAAGAGMKLQFNDAWFMDFSYMFRDYGKMEAVSGASMRDFNIMTNSFDIGFGVKF